MIGMAEADTAVRYRRFGEVEARGNSPIYERLALAVAEDADLLWRLDALPYAKRQPNLLFGAVRYLGGPIGYPGDFHDWTLANWSEVTAVMKVRRTQTNETGRCAALMPVLASLPQPVALLEVGASAGLCLYPDRYAYRYDDGKTVHEIGESSVVLDCDISGPVPLPGSLPQVAWRAGLDLNPLDVTNPDDVAWLQSLVWPDQPARAERLKHAVEIAAADPPHLVRGDVLTDLPELARQAPAGATLVIFHSAVLAYVAPNQRDQFRVVLDKIGSRWVSQEGPGVLPWIPVPDSQERNRKRYVLALDGVPQGFAAAHGQALDWLL